MDVINDITIQPDANKIVTAGFSYSVSSGSYDFALARYNLDGSLDTTFSRNGKLRTDFAGLHDRAKGVVVFPNNKILVVGEIEDNGTKIGLVRYNADGSLDTSFGNGGKISTNAVGYVSAMAIQADGKIVVVGEDSGNILVVRLEANGTPDLTFATAGVLATSIAGVANAVAIQADGRIVVAGQRSFIYDDFFLIRLHF